MSVGPFGQEPGNELAGATTCPHCHGVAQVSPHPRLNQVCNICGAPRIDLEHAPKLSGDELPSLLAARTAERKRLQWKVGGVFGGAVTSFAFALWTLWALIVGTGMISTVVGLALSAPFFALAVAGYVQSKRASAKVDKALHAAWKSAARDLLMAHPGGMTAKQLSEELPLSLEQAEQVAAELSVDNTISSRVTEDGRLVLQAVGSAGPRIATVPVQADEPLADPLEQRFAELEQAQQQAEHQIHQPQRYLKK